MRKLSEQDARDAEILARFRKSQRRLDEVARLGWRRDAAFLAVAIGIVCLGYWAILHV